MANNMDAPEGGNIDRNEEAGIASRRGVLKLGAVAVPAVATLSPSMAMAQGGAAVSMMACQVRIPEMVDADGHIVPGNAQVSDRDGRWYYTKGDQEVEVFKVSPGFSYSGQEIKDATAGGSFNAPPGIEQDKFHAHVRYMREVRNGNVPGAGMSCLMSVTNSLNIVNI